MSRSHLVLAAALVAGVGAPVAGGAQEASAIAAVAPSLDPESAASVAREIERARERGLPVAPLLDKVRQGSVMRASGARIRAAVSALAGRMATAREALAPSPSTAEIIAGADALSVGAPREALRRVRQATPPNASVAVPLGVLAQLVSRGVPAERAAGLVVRLVAGGAAPAQLIALGAEVEADVAAGIPAEAALDVRVRGVQMQATGAGGLTAAEAPTPTAIGPGTTSGGPKSTGTKSRPKRP